MTDNNMEAWVAWGDANLPARPPDMPGPNETRLNLIDGVEYITARADDFRAEIARLREDNRRLTECWNASVTVQEQTEADIERLRLLLDPDAVDDFAALQAERDQWQKKLTEDAWPEIERLRAGWDEAQTFMALALEREERLRAALERLVECGPATTLKQWREAQAAGAEALGRDKVG